MAKTNFTRERKRTWATSSLPGPPGSYPCHPPTLRYKHSLPLHEAGPYSHLLIRQCLKLLDEVHDGLEGVAETADFDGLRAAHGIRHLIPGIHAVSGMLRAYFDGDAYVSVAKVVTILGHCRDDLLQVKRGRHLGYYERW